MYYYSRESNVDLQENDLLSLIASYDDSNLVPYFYLFILDREKYMSQKEDLLQVCIECPTAKNLYLKSFLESYPNE